VGISLEGVTSPAARGAPGSVEARAGSAGSVSSSETMGSGGRCTTSAVRVQNPGPGSLRAVALGEAGAAATSGGLFFAGGGVARGFGTTATAGGAEAGAE